MIRVGLNPTEELSGGEAVAGAYDPALGERVLSRMYRNRAEKLLSAQPEMKDAVFYVHPRRISVMVGQKREYLLSSGAVRAFVHKSSANWRGRVGYFS